MTAPNYCVLDGTTGVSPARPDVLCEAMGGLQYQNSVTHPPLQNQHVFAEDFKQHSMLIERLCRMMPVLVVEFEYETGAVTVVRVLSAVDAVTIADIAVATVGGTHFDVSWASGSLPTKTRSAISGGHQVVQSGSLVSVYPTVGLPEIFYVVEIFGE